MTPAFNEEANIESVVNKINKVAPKYTDDYEILIINDGSTDKTGKVAEGLAKKSKRIRVFHNSENKGMGYSYLRGLKEARFEHIMINFGDDDHPAESLVRVISHMGEADIVIPFYTNFHITKTWFRHVLSISYTHLVNYLTELNIRYYNGITLHKTDLVRKMPIRSKGFGFQAEIIIYLVKTGATFIEVGIVNQDRKMGASSALRPKNILSVSYFLFRLFWKYRLRLNEKNI